MTSDVQKAVGDAPVSDSIGHRLTPAQAVVAIIVVGAALRLLATSQLGIEDDGIYSVVVSRKLSWAYFDHPPLHYWLIRLSALLFGTDSPFAVHFPFIVLNAASVWLLFRITAFAFGERAGLWAAAAFSIGGIFSVAFGFFVVPDGPLYFCSLLAVRLLMPVFFSSPEPRHAGLLWLAAGAAAGGALLSKYIAVFLFFGLFVFLVTSSRQRHWLVRVAPWLGVAISLLMFAPVVIWNSQHDWVSFLFQSRRALPSWHFSIIGIFENIGTQAFYLVPWFFIPLTYVLVKALIRGPRDERSWLFACLAIGPIAGFTLLTLSGRVLPYWQLPGWLFVFPLLGAELAGLSLVWRQRARLTALATAFVLILAVGALLAEARSGAYARYMSAHYPKLQLPVRDPMIFFYNWDGLPSALRERHLLDERIKFIASIDWHSAARVAYVLGRDYPVLCLGFDMRQFALDHPRSDFAQSEGLLIDTPEFFERYRPVLDTLFDRHERIDTIVLNRGGRPTLTLVVERVSGLRPLPPAGQMP
ncbi:MAG: glycosyltransferase family 39 protein [Proteobacteria bacterium]|nr:glycosyltransferase family 39 protein [Pseudomonadota bacterium]